MSTFGGKIKEIPSISVDRFDEENLNSQAYFLSHWHSDHTRGLTDFDLKFWFQLKRCNKMIYASEVTCTILARNYPDFINNIKQLCFYTPTTINVENETFSVTIIPAGHSPGSVMFLFETQFKKILYTGDYRIHKNDITKFKQFSDYVKDLNRVDKIYLDTTFFLKCYPEFPMRTDSLQEICRLIENHIKHGKDYLIHLKTGAYYGYEMVFQEIYKRFGMPVHVRDNEYNFYKMMPDLDSAVTLDGIKTQIHGSCGGHKTMCKSVPDGKLLTLLITAFSWVSETLNEGIAQRYGENAYKICYSTHASLEEGIEFIKSLKPKEIEVCVKPRSHEQIEEMDELIKELLNDINSPQKCVLKPKFFYITSSSKKVKYCPEKYSAGCLSDILKSPPREKRLYSCKSFEEVLSPSKSPSTTECSTRSLLNNNQVIKLEDRGNVNQSALEVNLKKIDQAPDEELQITTKEYANTLIEIIESKECSVAEPQINMYEKSKSDNSVDDVIRSLFFPEPRTEKQFSEGNENIYSSLQDNNQLGDSGDFINSSMEIGTKNNIEGSSKTSEISTEESPNILLGIIESVGYNVEGPQSNTFKKNNHDRVDDLVMSLCSQETYADEFLPESTESENILLDIINS